MMSINESESYICVSLRNPMDARAFAAPKGLRPRRRVKPRHDRREVEAAGQESLA
jgi:hypothetical protein